MQSKSVFGILGERQGGLVRQVMVSLRRRIMAGSLILIPILVAFLPVFYLYPKLNALAVKVLHISSVDMPGTSFLVALFLVLAALYILGLLAATFVVRWGVRLVERILTQIPIIAFFYKMTKQVIDLMTLNAQKPFRKVALVEYPRKGTWGMGFVTGESVHPELGLLVHVFLPTTPNPTSGFLLLMPPSEVVETECSVDQAIRFIISGGIIDPGLIRSKPYQSELLAGEGAAPSEPAPTSPEAK
ncbi:MAG: DUF502 domain-containing protein [Candidatus Sumerlaeota bacterium]|nr:DUF502 domain-containing protein [Candidatus Sumerlaeota bacterium]